MSIRNAIVAAVFITAPTLVGCRSLTGNFQTMRIVPDTLKVKLEEPLPLRPIPDHDFYWRMEVDMGFLVDHFGDGQGIRYNAFFLDPDSAIHTRSKYQVLMQGPYAIPPEDRELEPVDRLMQFGR